jgi:formamidopyrimidine-DNA glycosylase
MPELPEVEFGRKLLERVAVGRTITRVWCADDRIVFSGVAPRTVRERLTGRRVLAARRKGKHLWLELDRRPSLLIHFGMTGALRVPGDEPIRLRSTPAKLDRSWPPRFCKLRLWLSDGGELAMVDGRRLGRIRLREDPEHQPPIAALGFDPLLELPTPREFARRLRARRGAIKGVLLDQAFAAGVGNWIADEVLYQAGIDPRRTVGSLRAAEIAALRRALGRVVRTAVRVDARKEAFPRTWLFHRRWGGKGATTVQGERIVHVRVAGRTTAFVPSRQR